MCSNSESGCGWVGELRSLDNHLITCEYTVLCCPNECTEDNNEVTLLRRDLDQHLKNCPNRQYECRHCEATGRYCDITTTHLDTCPKMEIPCPNSDCKALVARCDLADHLTMCGYALLRCSNECLENNEEVRILRHNLDHHLKNECPNRQYQCPHCKDTGKHCDITTTHLDTCPKVKVPCPNDGCKASVPRCDVADHQSKCQFEKVPCKYAGIGCKEKPLRKDLQQHENNDAFHLHLAIETVNEQQKKVNKQQEDINKQQGEIKKQQKQVNKQWEDINKQRQDINELLREIKKQWVEIDKEQRETNKQWVEISKQQREIKKQRAEIDKEQKETNKQWTEISKQQEEMKSVKAQQKTMSDSIIAAQDGPIVFKMPEFKSYKHGWFSPPFYSHPGGYKMCIRVDANGFGEGAGTHVSVFVYLMRGKNDDNLPWPFTGEVTITLLNQLADKNHYTDKVSFPQDHEASRRVVSSEWFPRGYELRKFIPHNRLDRDAAKNCHYLKDDCLFFQMKIKTKPVTPSWLTCTF